MENRIVQINNHELFKKLQENNNKCLCTVNETGCMCDEFKNIVLVARKVAKPGQIVLFSPASASFDLFRNFEERGNKFKELVSEL